MASPALLDRALSRAAALLSSADAVYITCGAGVSVDSGPRKSGSPEDAASPALFRDDPELAWGFYGHRLGLYRAVAPHRGYEMLTRYVRDAKGGRGFVFTSNVDGHWAAAGWPAERILECHGSLHHLQCENPRCCYHAAMRRLHPIRSTSASTTAAAQRSGGRGDGGAVVVDVAVDPVTLRAERSTIPRCPRGCGNIGRPNVLMFGDPFFIADRLEEQTATHDAWLAYVHGLTPLPAGGGAGGRGDGGDGSLSPLRQRQQRLVVLDIGSGTAIPTCRLQGESTARYHASLSGGGSERSGRRTIFGDDDRDSPAAAAAATAGPPGGPVPASPPAVAAALIRVNPREAFIASPCPPSGEWVELPLGALEAIQAILSRVADGGGSGGRS
jgi:NAD-dependent SIR2 family protein deacetylase